MIPLATNKYSIGHFSRPVNQVCYLIRAKQVSYLVLGFYRPVDRVESPLDESHTQKSLKACSSKHTSPDHKQTTGQLHLTANKLKIVSKNHI